MKRHIGVKLVDAREMTRQEYNDYRGWELPEDENGDDTGFLVEYLDGGQPNHKNHKGYISWSPTTVFINAYRPVDGMNFGLAIEAIKMGKKVARKGWNGKDMFLYLQEGSMLVNSVNARNTVLKEYMENQAQSGEPVKILPHIDMKAADGAIVVGWLASQTDMLSDDWFIVD